MFLVIKSEISGIDVNSIIELREATFFEDVFFMKVGVPQNLFSLDIPSTSGSILKHVERMTNVRVEPSCFHSRPTEFEEVVEPRRSKRPRITKNLGSDYITYLIEDDPPTF